MILVSLLGDFDSSILPVFYELRNDIKTHILVYDDFKKDVKKAENLKVGIENFKNLYSFEFETLYFKIDEDSKNSIDSLINYLKTITDDYSSLIINSTDGHATINTLLSLRLIPLGTRFICYDRYDNHANLISQDSVDILGLKKSIPIKDYFLLKNYDMNCDIDKDLVLKYKNDIKSIFEDYLDEYKDIRKKDVKVVINSNNSKKIYKILKTLLREFNPTNKQSFLNGTLYELYVATIVSEYDVDDFEIGVKLYDYERNINEFDILFTKDNHVHMIECKYTKSFDILELVYKYISLQKLLDEDGKMAIVTKHNDYFRNFDEYTKNKEYATQRRALSNNIIVRGNIINYKDKFNNDMNNFFNLKKLESCTN